MQIEKIGAFSTISNKYIICYDEEEEKTYFCKNLDIFSQLKEDIKQKQEITKHIGGVLFFKAGVLQKCYADKIVEEHLKWHVPGTTDEKLESLIHLCAGADTADWKIIREFEKIEKWSELNIASGLSAGLGFPGTGVSLLRVKQRLPFLPEIYVQIVDSYFEGYCVTHIMLSKELVSACNTPEIKNLFKEKINHAD